MRTTLLLGLLALAHIAAAPSAHARGGRGIRAGDTGYEKELKFGRVTKDDMPPRPAGDPRRLAEAEPEPPRPDGRDRELASNVRAADYDWRQWWAVNRWSVLPDRAAIRKRRARWEIEGGRKPPDLGKRSRALRDARRHRRASILVPALLHALAPEMREGDVVRAAALLALGKTVINRLSGFSGQLRQQEVAVFFQELDALSRDLISAPNVTVV